MSVNIVHNIDIEELSIDLHVSKFHMHRIFKEAFGRNIHKRLSKNYSYDSETMTLLFNNEPQILPKRQIQIIELLAHNRSLVVQYDMFRNYVWNDDFIDNATIRAEVNRVKKVLKEDFIKNIRGSGYMVERPN